VIHKNTTSATQLGSRRNENTMTERRSIKRLDKQAHITSAIPILKQLDAKYLTLQTRIKYTSHSVFAASIEMHSLFINRYKFDGRFK